MSLLEDNVKDVETERDELKAKVADMLSAAEQKANVSQFYRYLACKKVFNPDFSLRFR